MMVQESGSSTRPESKLYSSLLNNISLFFILYYNDSIINMLLKLTSCNRFSFCMMLDFVSEKVN